MKYIAAIIAIIAVLGFWWMYKYQSGKEPIALVAGTITQPHANQEIGRTINCKGTIKGLKPYLHAWMMVREFSTTYWPKEQILDIDSLGNWEATIFEDGKGDDISLVLMVIADSTQQKILNWYAEAAKSGHYPGMQLSEGRVLDHIEGLKIQDAH